MATTVGDPHPRNERAAVNGDGRSLPEMLAENEALRRELDAARARARDLEAELVAVRRLGGAGPLAGGVAHDFSNVMAVIAGYADLMLRRLEPNDPLRAGAAAIQRATAWGLDLSERVLALSRAQAGPGDPADLDAVVSGVVETLRPFLGAAVAVDVRLGAASARVPVPAGALEQVVMNLVLNARDAMAGTGRLTVETAGAEVEDPVSHARRPGVRLALTDTGCGMDADTLARAFQPHFTTKAQGKGMGLGLPTVLAIATQHGGRVSADSAPGRGSTFTVFLPRVDCPGAPAAGTGEQTILVVDDEPGVRELVREILELHGYAVLEARDAEEALSVSAAHAGPIALVVADLRLEGGDGEAIVKRLRAQRPGLRAVFMSGAPDELEARYGRAPDAPRVLQKPFSVDALARAVVETLGRDDTAR